MIVASGAQPVLAKPNFTGKWVLNAAKSSFGDFPAPSSMTIQVTHDDPKLKTWTHESEDKGDWDIEATYTTDGKECSNETFNTSMKSVLTWDGGTLVFDTKGTAGDSEFTSEERWMLSQDGKLLTITRNFKSAMGDSSQNVILEKQ